MKDVDGRSIELDAVNQCAAETYFCVILLYVILCYFSFVIYFNFSFFYLVCNISFSFYLVLVFHLVSVLFVLDSVA